MAVEQTSAPFLGLCPRPGGSPSEHTGPGAADDFFTWSPCVSSDVPLSGDGIPASPSHRVTALAPAGSPIWTWSCTRYVVLLLLYQVSGGGRRGEKPKLLCKTPVSCVPLVAACCCGVSVSVVSRSLWCEMTGRNTTRRRGLGNIMSQVRLTPPVRASTTPLAAAKEGSDLIWCRPSCCATPRILQITDRERDPGPAVHTSRKHWVFPAMQRPKGRRPGPVLTTSIIVSSHHPPSTTQRSSHTRTPRRVYI